MVAPRSRITKSLALQASRFGDTSGRGCHLGAPLRHRTSSPVLVRVGVPPALSYRHARLWLVAVDQCPAHIECFHTGRHDMSVARITEISSISTKSFEDAVVQGIDRANKTLKNVKGAWSRIRK